MRRVMLVLFCLLFLGCAVYARPYGPTYVWVGGYYAWVDGSYVWVPRELIRVFPGNPHYHPHYHRYRR